MTDIFTTGDVWSLLSVTVICSLVTLVFSSGRFARAVKYLSGLSVLCCVMLIVTPIVSAFLSFDIPDDGQWDGEQNGELIVAETGKYVAAYVAEAVSVRYGIGKALVKVTVSLSYENGTAKIDEVYVLLPETYSGRFAEIAGYVSTLCGAPCTVVPE